MKKREEEIETVITGRPPEKSDGRWCIRSMKPQSIHFSLLKALLLSLCTIFSLVINTKLCSLHTIFSFVENIQGQSTTYCDEKLVLCSSLNTHKMKIDRDQCG